MIHCIQTFCWCHARTLVVQYIKWMYFTQTQNKIQLEFYKLMNFLLYFELYWRISYILYWRCSVHFLYGFKITVPHTIYKWIKKKNRNRISFHFLCPADFFWCTLDRILPKNQLIYNGNRCFGHVFCTKFDLATSFLALKSQALRTVFF